MNMYRPLTISFIAAALLAVSGCVAASSNNQLPEPSEQTQSSAGRHIIPDVELADLEGQAYQFPKDFATDYTVIVFGFAHDQKESTESWMAPVLALQSSHPELSLFKVPVIDSSSAALRLMIRNGMRSGISEEDARKRTLTLFVDQSGFANALGLPDKTTAKAILFNKSGEVIWQGAGDANDEKIEALRSMLLTNPSESSETIE